MSGVIDRKGVQWEHCCVCTRLVPMKHLGYEKPTDAHKYGRDLCVHCVDTGIKLGLVAFDNIVPANGWQVVEVSA